MKIFQDFGDLLDVLTSVPLETALVLGAVGVLCIGVVLLVVELVVRFVMRRRRQFRPGQVQTFELVEDDKLSDTEIKIHSSFFNANDEFPFLRDRIAVVYGLKNLDRATRKATRQFFGVDHFRLRLKAASQNDTEDDRRKIRISAKALDKLYPTVRGKGSASITFGSSVDLGFKPYNPKGLALYWNSLDASTRYANRFTVLFGLSVLAAELGFGYLGGPLRIAFLLIVGLAIFVSFIFGSFHRYFFSTNCNGNCACGGVSKPQ